MNTDTIRSAISDYFNGERMEMYLIVWGSIAAVTLAGLLYIRARDEFARSFGLTVILVAVILSSTAISLLRRDSEHRGVLLSAAQGAQVSAILEQERRRIDVVISKYPIYRVSAAAIAFLALIAAMFSRSGNVGGAFAAILMAVAAQQMIDHYSEKRADGYRTALILPDTG